MRLVERRWRQADLPGAALVVAEAEDETEAEAVRKAAQAAGVPVNVIDRPDFCDFQFGTIVNRSPVVVGISTDGAAPILGQVIRRRIETLIPQALAGWARAAARVENATRPDERVETTTLGALTAWQATASGPVLLAIGRVFAGTCEADGTGLVTDASMPVWCQGTSTGGRPS